MENAVRKATVIAALEKAVRRELSQEELRRQRVSFVLGTVKSDSVTIEYVQKVVDQKDEVSIPV